MRRDVALKDKSVGSRFLPDVLRLPKTLAAIGRPEQLYGLFGRSAHLTRTQEPLSTTKSVFQGGVDFEIPEPPADG